ncbi:MAG: hypothetical protein R3F18_17310 [Lysobacterales bacterium]|nr:hypothetical protein [Xanthomonadales bacterium]
MIVVHGEMPEIRRWPAAPSPVPEASGCESGSAAGLADQNRHLVPDSIKSGLIELTARPDGMATCRCAIVRDSQSGIEP